jgi:hypothetical protein
MATALLASALGVAAGAGAGPQPSDTTPISAVGAASGDAAPTRPTPARETATASPRPRPSASSPTPEPSPTPDLAAELAAAVAGIEAETGATLGVALLAAGADPTALVSAGTWVSGRAWSTIKVPITIAALDAGGSGAAAVLAITQSDNAAARQLWNSLGDREAAAAATEAVLAADPAQTTTVERIPFGHTVWDLAAQARFAAAFPTSAGAERVWELMAQIDPSQSWGLGRFDGAHFKGGWSPDQDGYVVRQFGQVPLPTGCAAIAIGATAATFQTGTDALNQLADALANLAGHLPTGPCR